MKKNEQVHTDCDTRTAAIRNRYVLEHSERVVFAALDSAGALARLVGGYPDLKYQVLAWSNEEIYGVGAGEGLDAVRGYQSGAEGAAVAMPTLSREIETVWAVTLPLPGANSAFAARSESAPCHVPPMFVAECDIRKFFDNISHDVVRRRWREIGFDAASERVLAAYLDVYVAGTHGNGRDARCPCKGLPQGGSFSTVLANLVLAAADDAVAKVDDGRLFYARYCDDVVFAHPDEEICRRAMAAYEHALSELDLPMHPIRSFTYRPLDGSSTAYYEIKSKGPFRWGEPALCEENCAPWVSFLGSQVRYDGETRIRKESIEKHIRSLGRETARAVREIQKGKPFSYCGFLEKAARPTNMRPCRRRLLLQYSEL